MGTQFTPRGYQLPDTAEKALVPAHLRTAFLGVDSDITAVKEEVEGRTVGRLIPSGTNMDDLTGKPNSGRWYVESASKASTLINFPSGAAANVDIISGPQGYSYTRQIVYEFGVDDPKIYTRSLRLAGRWTPWIRMGASGGDAPAVSDSHALREQVYKAAYPLKSTEGKGVVVFRYDHGLTNIKNTLLPLHQQYDVPFYIAMNSRNWGLEENSGATPDDVKAWIASGLVEVGNHSSDHLDRNTSEGIWDTIVNGRKELEAQLGITVHGYTPPGLSEFNQFEGFGVGGQLDNWSDTYAGGVILANHGIVAGGGFEWPMLNAYRTLDGVVRQGHRHFTWEGYAFARIKQQIDQAVASKTGYTIMAHPRVMNGNGYFTPAIAEQVIAYVRKLIDEGKLARLSYYESLHATTEPLEPVEKETVAAPAIITGTGRPDDPATLDASIREKAQAAEDGAVFFSSNGGGARAWQWQKTYGTWSVTVGDTGERVVGKPANIAIMTDGKVLLRREGNTVTMTVDNATFSASGVPSVAIPAGFRPQAGRTYAPLNQGNTTRGSLDQGYSASSLVIRVSAAAPNVGGAISWSTTDSWPMALPGTSL